MDPNSCSSDSGYPPGYLQIIRFLHKHDTSADILLTENGWCGNETIDNPDQLWYHRTHLEQVHKAIYEEDIPIIGYTVWASWMTSSGPATPVVVDFSTLTTLMTGDTLRYRRSFRVFSVRLVLGTRRWRLRVFRAGRRG